MSMSTSDTIAIVSAAISLLSGIGAIVSASIAFKALDVAKEVSSDNKKMFKRQGVIELHMAWQGVNMLDMSQCITPDIVRAVNALALTASLWNHDIIEKSILYQTYWGAYKELYDSLENSTTTAPGLPKRCRDYITPDMTKAYEDMRKCDLEGVTQTKI